MEKDSRKKEEKWQPFEDLGEARFRKLLSTIFYLCDLAGFKIEERIVLTDKRTGKTWR